MVKPKIVLDVRMVGEIPHGIARYVCGILGGLAVLRKELPYETVLLTERGFSERPLFKRELLSSYERVEIAAPFLSPLEVLEIPRALSRVGAALYHSPSFSSLAYAPCPWIVTLHDLNHLSYGDWRERLYYRTLLRSFARRARRVVAVSRFSRAEISGWLGPKMGDESAIPIVGNSIDSELGQPNGREPVSGLERGRYFLCLSNPKPHKNLAVLFKAYRDYRERSSSPWELATNVEPAEPVPGVRVLSGLNDSDGRAVLMAAGAVAAPSLYEGFGILPVEAIACGVRVLASDIPPHREGLEGFPAEWIPAQNAALWTDALLKAEKGLLLAPTLEDRRKILARYSPARVAMDMDRVYRDVLNLGS